MLKSEARADIYRANARQARAAAKDSVLVELRRKLEGAAAAWQGLADHEDARTRFAQEVSERTNAALLARADPEG